MQHHYSWLWGTLLSRIRVTEHSHCDTATVDLITKKKTANMIIKEATKCLQRDDSCPRQDRARRYKTTHNGMQFKTLLFISGTYHLIFSECG